MPTTVHARSTPARATPGPTPTRRALPTTRLLATLIAGLLAAVGVVLGAAPAQAHDAFTGSTPADKATVATTPDSVTIDFEEPPTTIGLAVKVTGPTGDVQDGSPRIVGSTVTQALLPAAPAGAYRIAWRITADDGHPVSGELTFTSSAPNARQATATPLTPATGSGSGTAGATTSASSTPVATSPTSSTDSGTPVLPIVLVVVIVLAGIVVALVMRRRRGA